MGKEQSATLFAELIEAALLLADKAAQKFGSWMDERRTTRKLTRHDQLDGRQRCVKRASTDSRWRPAECRAMKGELLWNLDYALSLALFIEPTLLELPSCVQRGCSSNCAANSSSLQRAMVAP